MGRAEEEFMHVEDEKGGGVARRVKQRMLKEREENCRGRWLLPLTMQNAEWQCIDLVRLQRGSRNKASRKYSLFSHIRSRKCQKLDNWRGHYISLWWNAMQQLSCTDSPLNHFNSPYQGTWHYAGHLLSSPVNLLDVHMPRAVLLWLISNWTGALHVPTRIRNVWRIFHQVK